MGPLLERVNYVADRIGGEHPNVQVTTLAYLNTVVPPKTFGPSPNVVPWLATDAHAWGFGDLFVWDTERSARAMQQWHDAWQASTVVWDYPSHFGFSPYNLNLPTIADNLKWYAQRGAVGIYFQTQHNENNGFPQSYQRSWLFAKLGWDPARNTSDLVRDFNYGFYGKAAAPMQRYDDMLHAAWGEWRKHREEEGYTGPVDVQFAERGLALMAEALGLAEGDEELVRRIDIARLPLLFIRRHMSTISLRSVA